VGWIADRPRPVRLLDVVGAGLLVGAAALTKVTGLLFVPIAGLVLVLCQRGTGRRAILVRAGLFLGTIALSAGWWYVWTWTRTGHWIVLPWNFETTGFAWWQEPGYRTAGDFLRFGRALVRPFYASTAGFWDGLYSCAWMDGSLSGGLSLPPWHYSPMYACVWLAVPLTLAGVHGMVRARSGTERGLQLFATGACALFGLSILESYLRMPCYSSGKPSYALGLLGCFALLIAIGARPLLARPVLGALAGAWIVLFGGCSYAAFWSL
jgi:4-amino-4-deoxy-L-arabinose transferase-like glycosyltransferase